MSVQHYADIYHYKMNRLKGVQNDHFRLNHLHEDVMIQVVKTSVKQVTDKYGRAPAAFSFFVMGSAGRHEQSILSDQDHGIIYSEESDGAKDYFLALGQEISDGLYQTGYEYCDGAVMANNPLWCKSRSEWQKQLQTWCAEASWENVRHLLILIDCRCLYGQHSFVEHLKREIYGQINDKQLLASLYNNTMHFKKAIGVFGQFLTENYGIHAGSVNIKNAALLPYINSVRLMAVKNGILDTSTLARLDRLPIKDKNRYKQAFLKLLHYRLTFSDHADYEKGHYILIDRLNKEQRKELKALIRTGYELLDEAGKMMKGDDQFSHE